MRADAVGEQIGHLGDHKLGNDERSPRSRQEPAAARVVWIAAGRGRKKRSRVDYEKLFSGDGAA
jgi:hypothetical protein